MNKRLVGTGLAIGLVAGAGAGFVMEMAGSAGASSGAAVAVRAAVANATTDTAVPADPNAPTNPNAPTPAARPDRTTELQKILQPLIDDGTITQAQADKVIAALAAAPPQGGPMGGHKMGGRGGIGGFGLDAVAKTLGITAADVRTALESGQSLADLAVSKGKTAQDVIDAVVAEATTKINAEVTAKHLTQADADKILANLKTLATDFVNNTRPAGGPGMGRGFGGPMMGGPGFGGPGHRGNDNDADDGAPGASPDTTVPTVTG
jgi:polyhydroxyalkanoate synthesis regulator phasin